jgi:hypothetical protein
MNPTLKALAEGLAAAYDQDEQPESEGHDISAGMFGPNVSAWLKSVAAQINGCPPGWSVSFDESRKPISLATIRAPNGYAIDGAPWMSNPGNVIHMLALAMAGKDKT